MHREERDYVRRKSRLTPDLNSPSKLNYLYNKQRRLSKQNLNMIQSHDDRSVNNSETRQLDSGLNSRDGERMTVDNLSGTHNSTPLSPSVSGGRNSKMNRTIQTNLTPLGNYPKEKHDEYSLRQTLISRINNFLPNHKHDYTEKRFQHSSVKEMQNAIGRQRHL